MSYIEYYKKERKKALSNAKTLEDIDRINSFFDNCLKNIKGAEKC